MVPAGEQQPGKRPQPTQAAFALVLVQSGMAKARRRMPADGKPAVLAVGDVHRPVDQNREPQAGPGAELQHADAALHAVSERHQPHAGKLRQRARVGGNVPSRHVTTK
jgi:hypothetical protein